MTFLEITQAERAGWQQRAARELATILDTHRDLPVIGWSLALGSTVVGQVTGLAPAYELRRVFDAWRTALRLPRPSEVTFSDGTVHLKATAARDHVRVTLTATLRPDADPEVAW